MAKFDVQDIYRIDLDSKSSYNKTNWYKEKPYTFVFTNKLGESYYFNLPISPSNLTINTHFATNLIPTMYGTVEEHSEQRYFDIVISGTTGMTPKYVDSAPLQGDYILPLKGDGVRGDGRLSFKKDRVRVGGFFQRTLNLVGQTANNANDAINLFLKNEYQPGVFYQSTGYAAFHNFYRFLLSYKKEISNTSTQANNTDHPLVFINYKDNNKYNVSISSFQLTRDAGNPLLYNYTINMRGYNLRSALEGKEIPQEDTLKKLGLDGITSSVFSKMANTARLAKNTAYAAIAAIKGAGR